MVSRMSCHPNLVKFVEVVRSDQHAYLVYEMIDGYSLKKHNSQFKNFMKEKYASRIIRQVAQGIKYLHDHGIMHRDLKCDNIVMSDKSKKAIPKVIDFGFAKFEGTTCQSID